MGHAQWRLHNSKKPEGQLDRVKYFLPADNYYNYDNIDYCHPCSSPPQMTACSVSMPEKICKETAVIMVARNLAGEKTRSIELWWDAAQNKMNTVLVAADWEDLLAYRRAFSNTYPDAEFAPIRGTPIPGWFDPEEPYQIFDVGTNHGHYAAVFDRGDAPRLMPVVAGSLWTSQNAWVQLAFKNYPFDIFLERHANQMNAKRREIIYYGNPATTGPSMHPEAGCDIDENLPGLLSHAIRKIQYPLVMMSVRGLVRASHRFDLSLDHIRSMQVERHASRYEHLTRFAYRNFWNPARPQNVRIIGSNVKCPRINIFGHRLLPDPQELLDSALNRYFEKNRFGMYRDRNPLPFLMLNQEELPLFVRPPDLYVSNIDMIRGNRDAVDAPPQSNSGWTMGGSEL